MEQTNLSLVRWAGGKGKQLESLLPLIPPSRVYVEPFGGGGSVLLNRPRSEIEVYNDLDHSLVNLFRVVRDARMFDAFSRMVGWIPYSREEFESALDFESETDQVVRAAKFYTVLNQSISGKRLAGKSDWARARSDNVAERWVLRQEKLGRIHARLEGVQLECRDALDVISAFDGEDTVFYCDPPYVLETRTSRKYYAVEPGDGYHIELVEVLRRTRGAVVLSGYLHPIYEPLMDEGWTATSYESSALMTVQEEGTERDARKEVVWRNPKALTTGTLF